MTDRREIVLKVLSEWDMESYPWWEKSEQLKVVDEILERLDAINCIDCNLPFPKHVKGCPNE